MLRHLILAALAFLAAPAVSAEGLFGGPSEHAQARLFAGWADGASDGRRIAGLSVTLSPGWKTYWRRPGDAGIPPRFDWTGSDNLADVKIAWPTPVVFETAGYRTIGYKDRMVLPLALTAADPEKPIRLKLEFFFGLCDDICIPARAELELSIPLDAPTDGAEAIRAALATTPDLAAARGLTAASCAIERPVDGAAHKAGTERRFSAALTFDPPLAAAPVVIADGPEGVWFGATEVTLDGAVVRAEGEVQTEPGVWIGPLTMTAGPL